MLDDATEVPDLTAIWEPLATRLDTHADAEKNVVYPALLVHGGAGNWQGETDDAIGDHNSIRTPSPNRANTASGSRVWYQAVGTARTENGKHLDEEEREPCLTSSRAPRLSSGTTWPWPGCASTTSTPGQRLSRPLIRTDTYIAERT